MFNDVGASRRSLVIIASVVVALATLAAGLAATALRSASYASTAEILIAPVGDSVETTASSSDTLSRGTIVSTFAQAYGSSGIANRAMTEAGITPADRARVTLASQVIAGTSIVSVTANAETPELAVRAAAAISGFVPELAGYSTAFRPQVIEPASPAELSGPSGTAMVAASLLLALVAGSLTAWVLNREVRRRRLRGRVAVEPVPAADDEREYEAPARVR